MKTQLILFGAGLCGLIAERAIDLRQKLLGRVFNEILIKATETRVAERTN